MWMIPGQTAVAQGPEAARAGRAGLLRALLCAIVAVGLWLEPSFAKPQSRPATEEESAALAAMFDAAFLVEKSESIYMRVSDAYPAHFVFVEPGPDREFRVWRVTLVGPLPKDVSGRGFWARQIAGLVADELKHSRAAGIAVWQARVSKATPRDASDVRVPEDLKFRFYLQEGGLIATTRFEFPPPPMTSMGQELRLTIPLSDDFGTVDELEALSRLERHVAQALVESGAGHVEHKESADGIFTIYCSGAHAEVMLDVLQPILQSAGLPEGSAAVLPGGFSGFVHKRVPL
ncbi:hypothetical protein ABI59_08925 [Acidobacteria bacterium Mor1]|nr:hypothetical protein ABI59_08925 [Acidobacteria bacterium Mor1]